MPLSPELRQVLATQRRRMTDLAEEQARVVADVYLQAREEAQRALATLPPDSAVAAQQRQIIAIADDVARTVEGGMTTTLLDIGRAGAVIGRQALNETTAVNDPSKLPLVRRIAPVEDVAGLLEPGLLEYYQASVENYGDEAIQRMRRAMATSMARGESVIQASGRIADAVSMGPPPTATGAPPYWAERIARTEASNATNAREQADAETLQAEDPDADWRKVLSATFDSRTGEDSKELDGQAVPVDEPFIDVDGTTYMHPPNRPNDREVMIILPAEDAREALRRAP